MKKIVWRNGMHQLIESGHKTFDRQTTLVSTGNQIGNTVLGWFIRSFAETECNGQTFKPGHLQNSDLARWPVPFGIREIVQQLTDEHNGSILYQFFHYGYTVRPGYTYHEMIKIEDGWVLTTTRHDFLKQWVTGPTYKSRWVVEEARLYVIKNHEEYDVGGPNRSDAKENGPEDQRRDARRSGKRAPR